MPQFIVIGPHSITDIAGNVAVSGEVVDIDDPTLADQLTTGGHVLAVETAEQLREWIDAGGGPSQETFTPDKEPKPRGKKDT